jgi:hypothetical protein
MGRHRGKNVRVFDRMMPSKRGSGPVAVSGTERPLLGPSTTPKPEKPVGPLKTNPASRPTPAAELSVDTARGALRSIARAARGNREVAAEAACP